ncbi:transport-associated protein [Rhizobium sp. Pop5]|nr:transport-associated protein [Rhizobium sp. Pop5]
MPNGAGVAIKNDRAFLLWANGFKANDDGQRARHTGASRRRIAMTFEPESVAHDQLASVQAAVAAEPELESSSISVSVVGRSVLLEGYVAGYVDREKATAIAASIAGPENVQDRQRDADQMADTTSAQQEPF